MSYFMQGTLYNQVFSYSSYVYFNASEVFTVVYRARFLQTVREHKSENSSGLRAPPTKKLLQQAELFYSLHTQIKICESSWIMLYLRTVSVRIAWPYCKNKNFGSGLILLTFFEFDQIKCYCNFAFSRYLMIKIIS